MGLKFSKMHGLGNDFMVIDAINQSVSLSPAKIQSLADRHFGIGFDQLLLIEPPDRDDVDFSYRIYNADGGEVEQCGNGARCFARFVRDKGLSDKATIPVSTRSGVIVLQVKDDGQVQVDMGSPEFEPSLVPFNAPANIPTNIQKLQDRYTLSVLDQAVEVGVVSMGNPHAVMLVDDIETAPVDVLGPALESHPDFPNQVNAGFMQVVDESHIHLRVYERGAGETLACGSGACAAVAIGRKWGLLAGLVEVNLRGGALVINWPNSEDNILMTGPAAHVFDGELEL